MVFKTPLLQESVHEEDFEQFMRGTSHFNSVIGVVDDHPDNCYICWQTRTGNPSLGDGPKGGVLRDIMTAEVDEELFSEWMRVEADEDDAQARAAAQPAPIFRWHA